MSRYGLTSAKFLLEPELQRLKQTLERFQIREPRNTLLIELALATGARASELLLVRRSHLNPTDRSITLFGLKGSNDREVPLKDCLFDRLQELPTPADQDRLFPISYFRFRQIWQEFRPVKKPLHSLRHTFAIELFKRTRDLRLVQLALGHRNIANTMIYADYVYSKEEMRRLIL